MNFSSDYGIRSIKFILEDDVNLFAHLFSLGEKYFINKSKMYTMTNRYAHSHKSH